MWVCLHARAGVGLCVSEYVWLVLFADIQQKRKTTKKRVVKGRRVNKKQKDIKVKSVVANPKSVICIVIEKYAISACILPAIVNRVCEGCIQVQHIEIHKNLNQNFPPSLYVSLILFAKSLCCVLRVCVYRLTSSKSKEQYIWKAKCRSRNCKYLKH